MKISKVVLLLLVLLGILLADLLILAKIEPVNCKCRRNQAIRSDRNIDIFQVTKNGPSVVIVLDYNLSTTSQLAENEAMALLVLFSQSTQEEPFSIQAAMLLFHTLEDQFFLFWMLGNPYGQAQNWQIGSRYEHFLTSDKQLTLTFIEFSEISNPETEITVLAKITSDIEVNTDGNDFRMTLNQFIDYLPLTYELPIIKTTTTEPTTTESMTTAPTTTEPTTTTTTEERTSTEPSLTAGFTVISLFGISISILITKKYDLKK